VKRLVLAMLGAALPALGWACPYCAAGGGSGREGYVAGTLVLLVLPVALVGSLVLWLRHAARPARPEIS
jgi:hypothetical protein